MTQKLKFKELKQLKERNVAHFVYCPDVSNSRKKLLVKIEKCFLLII